MRRSYLIAVSVLLLAGIFCSSSQIMAQTHPTPTTAYMWIMADGNPIEGPVEEPGLEGSIELLAFDHLIERPYDPDTGEPTGLLNHSPIWIKKQVDRASPLLFRALSDLQRIDLRIWFFQPDQTGTPIHIYTIETEQGHLISIQESMPDQSDPGNEHLGFYDVCGFVYYRILWVWEPDGIEYQMEWHGTNQSIANPAADEDLALMPPWPNPATGEANLRLALPMNTEADLQVFDLSGRRIRGLHSGPLTSWMQDFTWDGRNQRGEEVARGVYLIRLSWDGGIATKRVTWIR